MKKVFALLFVFICLIAALCFAYEKRELPQERFLGVWIPVENDRSWLSKVQITRSGKDWTLHVWSYATFTETDWGKVPLHLLGHCVDSKSLGHGLAVWNQDFAKEYMILYIENNQLVIENYTVFTDRSGRSNYVYDGRFRRSR